jgi:hypothetical protein
MSGEEILYCSGVDFETGGYALPPMPPRDLTARLRRGVHEVGVLKELVAWLESRKSRPRGLGEGDPRDLAQAGWGLLFAKEDPRAPAIREALRPLLEHRRQQAGTLREHRYREFLGDEGYHPGEDKESFLARHGAGPGPADPDRVPYYLMLLGDPASLPYDFQYQLDVPYAVGRLSFETLEEYERYARGVVAAETAPAASGPLRVALFGPHHPNDPATAVTADELVTPLAEMLRTFPGCAVETALGEAATKERLKALLGGGEASDLLFTAGHGIVLSNGNPRQPELQGGLLCQGWPGPEHWREPLHTEHFFSAGDLDPSAQAAGLISFHFCCYSAGSPSFDDFAPKAHARVPVSPEPFVARLPQRLLTTGALAVIGHVERAWPSSVCWPGVGRQIRTFEATLKRLLAGDPVGAAMEEFAGRYAELSTELNDLLQQVWDGGTVDETRLTSLWTTSHDARNFTVLGDPAVRLRIPRVSQTPQEVQG